MTSIGPKSLLRSLEMALSDLTVRQAKTTGKRYTLSDNDCLGLMVSAAGGKSWQFRYYWLGKQKRLCLG
ncbi:Arm DNA-binding domain-containing protein, partial [Klebsiella pneumoniae]|uniref:Arm DNA-binding domain-containing protein n=1 Tax=Klebsiella pneumoniae TaxID=573 RepID=UPI00404AAF68